MRLLSAFIFFAYCAVDFRCYGYGLYVIRNGGAREMVISSAVALPIQQLILTLPLLGVYRESFFWGDRCPRPRARGLVIFRSRPEGSFAASEREYRRVRSEHRDIKRRQSSIARDCDDNIRATHSYFERSDAYGRLESIKHWRFLAVL